MPIHAFGDPEQQQRWIDVAVREHVDNGADHRRNLRLITPQGVPP